MRSSKERILTTHAGSLSRPAKLIAMGRAGKNKEAAYAACLADAVSDVVRKQRELGIDIPDQCDGRSHGSVRHQRTSTEELRALGAWSFSLLASGLSFGTAKERP